MEANDKNKGKYKKKINEENHPINENSIEVVKVSPYRNCDILNNIFKKK
jgi:hypothetical protein